MNAISQNRECSLTDLDWQVVEIARSDGARSLNPDGTFARFLRDFFGWPVPRALSNQRAEALRRFSVRAWYWDFIRARDVRPLIDAGYSSDDAYRILAHVAGHRGFTPTMLEGAI